MWQWGCMSSVYIASQEGHMDGVLELLQNSVNVNTCDNRGRDPLNITWAQGGRLITIRYWCIPTLMPQ